MEISLLVPTYKRPLGLNRLIDTALKYADDPMQVRFGFCVNEKDTETVELISHKYFPAGEESVAVSFEKTRQPNLSKFWNMIYDETKWPIVSMIADDMEFCTRGWDTRIINTLDDADGNAIVFADDDYIAHEQLCVNMFTTRKLVEATKKPFMCPLFAADMIDTVWHKVGLLTGTLRYLPDVIIRHNHATRKPADQWDETMTRLAPIQKLYSGNRQQHKLADVYAHRVAMNLVMSGIGSWNTL